MAFDELTWVRVRCMGVMLNHERPSDFPGPDQHPRLAAELRGLANRQVAPADLDRRVLGGLGHVAVPVRWGRGLAIAALIALAIGLISALLIPHGGNRTLRGLTVASDPAAGPWDITADGQVDVLDAFALVKAIERGDGDGLADFNGDGHTDGRDVHVLTARIVRVDSGKDTGS